MKKNKAYKVYEDNGEEQENLDGSDDFKWGDLGHPIFNFFWFFLAFFSFLEYDFIRYNNEWAYLIISCISLVIIICYMIRGCLVETYSRTGLDKIYLWHWLDKIYWWIALPSVLVLLLNCFDVDIFDPFKGEKDGTKHKTETLVKTDKDDIKKEKEQTPKKSPKDEIRELGFNEGILYGYSDRGVALREYVQMGLTLEEGLSHIQNVIAKVAYKEDHGDNISDELLDEYAKQFIEGYKSVVLKK